MEELVALLACIGDGHFWTRSLSSSPLARADLGVGKYQNNAEGIDVCSLFCFPSVRSASMVLIGPTVYVVVVVAVDRS